MVNVINALAFIWGTYWALKAGRALLKGTRYSINFVMIIFYLFFILPLAFDIIFGIPKYTYERSFTVAAADFWTCALYALYVSTVPVLWQWTAIKKRKLPEHNSSKGRHYRKLFYLIVLASPLILAFFSPHPEIYLTYGAAILGFPTPESESYHILISASTFFSVICFSFLIMESKKSISLVILGLTPLLLTTIWINGKRNIIVWAFVLILYALWKRRSLAPRQLLITSILFLSIGLGISAIYQQSFRYESLKINSWEKIYANMRVDYGRDDVTKMAIYAELNPDQLKILQYRGQSMVYNLLFFIPREVWPKKPWPYAVYATAALLMLPTQYYGWGMTTSILDESIANFSWLGMLIGPLIISLICRLGDPVRGPVVQLLTVLTAILMLVLQLSAFIPVFLVWAALVFWRGRKWRLVWKSI